MLFGLSLETILLFFRAIDSPDIFCSIIQSTYMNFEILVDLCIFVSDVQFWNLYFFSLFFYFTFSTKKYRFSRMFTKVNTKCVIHNSMI